MYVDLRPWNTRPVEVLHHPREGEPAWYPGELEAYRRDRDGRWYGRVRYLIGVGAQHLDWVDQASLRRASSS